MIQAPRTAEVVVVGAGCIGASTAVQLTMAGIKDVVLVEKGGPAAMTTGRSSTFIRQHYSQPTFARWARESLPIWERFDEMFGAEPVFTRTGYATFGGPADAAPMSRTVEFLRGTGVRIELLGSADLSKLEPSIWTDDLACGAYEPDGGYCDPIQSVVGFLAAFERLGGRAILGVRVTGLRRDGATWRLETDAGTIATPIVVNAAGAYGAWLAGQIGLQLPIEHYVHDVAVFRQPPGFGPRRHLAFADLVGAVYYRPDGEGLTLAGSMNWSEGARVLDDPDAFPWVANPQVVARYTRRLGQRFPGFEVTGPERSWAGIYFLTPDRHPILGEPPGLEGFILACGFSHGFKVAPAVGKSIAALIAGGPRAAPELEEFRLSRFDEGKPVVPMNLYPSGTQS